MFYLQAKKIAVFNIYHAVLNIRYLIEHFKGGVTLIYENNP